MVEAEFRVRYPEIREQKKKSLISIWRDRKIFSKSKNSL